MDDQTLLMDLVEGLTIHLWAAGFFFHCQVSKASSSNFDY